MTNIQERFLTLKAAAPLFGFASGDAMRMAFRRGTLPPEGLIRRGVRTVRVDVETLTRLLRETAISTSA